MSGKTKLLLLLTICVLVTWIRMSNNLLNPTTGLLLLLTICCTLLLVVELLIRGLGLSGQTKTGLWVFVSAICLCVFGSEVFLRLVVARYATYMEENGTPNYVSLYRVNRPDSRLNVYPANQDVVCVKTEFTHSRKSNSLGLCEVEIPVAKKIGEYRIIALGDSYTEGVGTSYEKTWVKVMAEQLVVATGKRVAAINAGISGSDPCFEYMLLKEKLLPYTPDLVIIMLSSSDVNEIIVRGGFERFKTDGTTAFRPAPSWEPLYAVSHLFRHLIHDVFRYNRFLIRNSAMAEEVPLALDKLRTNLTMFSGLAAEHRFDLLVTVAPNTWEIVSGEYIDSLGILVSEVKAKTGLCVLDLLEHFRRENTMTKENVSQYYWKLDQHPNTMGYQLIGQAVAANILKKGNSL
jgi:lysophospholipase L1-like esterase